MLKKAWRSITFLTDTWRAHADPVGFARRQGVRMGDGVRIYCSSRTMFGSEPFLVKLGDNVHICDGARFITHDGGVLALRHRFPRLDVAAPITVGSNVVVGAGCIVLPGVVIGDDCVIGAGAVVARSIPSGTVAAGNPARPIKTIRDYLAKASAASLEIGHLSSRDKEQAYRRIFSLDSISPADLDCERRHG